MSRPSGRAILLLAALGAAGCRDGATPAEAVPEPGAPLIAAKIGAVQGLDGPESVHYDPDQDVYFISNMVGFGSVKDGAAYIARMEADRLDAPPAPFIVSGRGGVALDAPKGMALRGDTLWVTDIDVIRGFHRRTGAPLATIDLRPYDPVLLNDLAAGPDGALYASDSGLQMSSAGVIYRGGGKIFVVAPDRAVSTLALSDSLGHPNGLAWDAAGKRWVVASFDPFESELEQYDPRTGTRGVLMRGSGRFDGVVALPDGRILSTSWNDSSVHLTTGTGSEVLIPGLLQPADLGYDSRRSRLMIPLVLVNRVEFWELRPR